MFADVQAYRSMLQRLPDDHHREGLQGTPERAAKAWQELTSGYAELPSEILTTFDADGYDEMVLLSDIPFYSLCEHHLLPFFGKAHVGYVPADRIVGISKLARLVHTFSRRLQNQERITSQIADCLNEHLAPLGVIVVIEARHLCMEMRGVRSWGQNMTTSALRGRLQDPEARAEALALIRR